MMPHRAAEDPTHSAVPRLSDWVFYHARNTPLAESGVEGDARLNYATLVERSSRLISAFKMSGISVGDRVAFLGLPGLDFLTAYISIMQVGAVWVGLSPKHRAAEFAHVLNDCTPRLVLVGASAGQAAERELEQATRLTANPIVIERYDHNAPASLALPPRLTAPLAPDIALIVYTSGTTGKPKGAMLRHASVIRAAEIYCERLNQSSPRALHNLPINHVGGLVDIAAPILLRGGALIFMPHFDPVAIPSVLMRERITNWGQVPAMFEMVDATGLLTDVSLPHLEAIIWSGSPMSQACLARLRRFRTDAINCYGLTETTGSVTLTSVGAPDDVLLSTVGKPAEPSNLRLRSQEGIVTAPGEPGEIQVRGMLVMAGYYGDQTATTETFTGDGWLRTGDVGSMTEDGNLQLIGRIKEMFKSGGYNVYPREIEMVLESCPGVEMAAVIGVPNSQWTEVGHAFVLSHSSLTKSALYEWCRARLANYKIPKHFTITGELPLLPIGKVNKVALRAWLSDSDRQTV